MSIEIPLSAEFVDRKDRGLMAQVSQTEGRRASLGPEAYRRVFSVERFGHHPFPTAVVTGE